MLAPVAFSDGSKAIADDGFVSRALAVLLWALDGLLILYPENKAIAGKAQVNESKNNVLAGYERHPGIGRRNADCKRYFLGHLP
jgi:dihydroorotase